MTSNFLSASPYNRCKGSIYLVFDFCEHDLAGLLSNAHVKFTLSEIKKVMQMLLNGLYYIHRNKVRIIPCLPGNVQKMGSAAPLKSRSL